MEWYSRRQSITSEINETGKQFDKNEIPDSIDETLICATFDMLYSPKRFKDDFKKKLSKFQSNLNAFEKDTSDNRINKTRKFLAWIKKEAQKFD